MDVITLIKNKITGQAAEEERNSHELFTGDDTLVIFDNDKNSSNIVDVTNVTDNEVKTRKYVVPRADCEITSGPYGRIFFYRAPTRSIETVEHLAALERNTVLTQITSYKPVENNVKFNWTTAMLWFVVVVLIIIVAVK